MSEIRHLILRNMRLFFKDRGMLVASMISPLILLVLYVTFLYNVYRDIFISGLAGLQLPDRLIDGCVGGQLLSSILAVCCVTVAFSANLIMVQDKVSGARNDLLITPVKPSSIALGYYVATAINTAIICLLATGVGLGYLALTGWYFTFADVLCLVCDVLLLVAFGTALSSVICAPLSTEGQISAVSTIIGAGYGFVCGAYMPISQFGGALQTVLSFLPGTYGTSLLRNHAMRGALNGLSEYHVPAQAIESIRDALDCNLYFFGAKVESLVMYAILAGAVVVLVALYVVMGKRRARRAK